MRMQSLPTTLSADEYDLGKDPATAMSSPQDEVDPMEHLGFSISQRTRTELER
jgi:hypothetical protein